MTNDQVITILRNVVDPEIGINVVDLGLIYNIKISEESLSVTMTLTTPGCPMHESMVQWVKNILEKYETEKKIEVKLVWEPAWSPSLMSADARAQLNM